MTSVSRVSAVIAGLVLSGCAAAGPARAPSSAASTGPAPSSPAACQAASPATRVSLSEADNGAVVCLARTGVVELYLHGTAADRWSPVAVTGRSLHSVPSGKSALPIGVTAGFFASTGTGEAVLSSYRSPCTGPEPGTPTCDSAHLVHIVVVVG